MPTLSALRNDPQFARLFAFVHVLCWPILVWQLNRFYSWTIREGIHNALYSVNRWGWLTVHYLGDRQDPDAYKPLARTFRPLTDASYASDLPANLSALETLTAVPTLPHEVGGGGISLSEMTEGALPSIPNTS
jgi:hypothetical protein